ncbi:hypothetical protein ATCC90586_011541 [Pythium insidiosum]|nr:hypothetical protein ATCC90586_011541 [Pythium insidiosum]
MQRTSWRICVKGTAAHSTTAVAHFELEQYSAAKKAFLAGKQAASNKSEALVKRFQTWIRKCDAELDSDEDEDVPMPTTKAAPIAPPAAPPTPVAPPKPAIRCAV